MMILKRIWVAITKITFLLPWLTLLPSAAQASFIETTIGTAVLNDATASYFNPAALVLMKNPQIITQGTVAYFRTQFTGQSTSVLNGVSQAGSSSSNTHYFSPSIYLGVPATSRLIAGLAIVTNTASRNVDSGSILRYVQAGNNIEDYDIVPALAIKINDVFSIGGGINFSHANFNLHPITGLPGSNMVDSQSDNQCSGEGVGGNVGFLVKPTSATVIGFNYRSMTTYRLSGKSVFEGTPHVVSNNYHFTLATPARSVLSINHFVTPKLGFIGTVQYFQWNTIRNVQVYGVANAIHGMPVILNGSIPFHLQNTWLFTLGTHYRINPKWILRVASSYIQSPGNPHYQVSNGDSIVLGASMACVINKIISIDGSYAHAFIQNQNMNINTSRFLVRGVNRGSRDGVSLKLTFNI
ncbi:MAG: OmpP1/FadL family transporter [Gammaproteobacteria bacterium]